MSENKALKSQKLEGNKSTSNKEVEDVANVVTAMESDSDEAPEEVPFTQSKETALSVLLAEKKGKRDVHDSKARKRQKTIALHIKEKEEKLKRLEVLASKKLPDNLLESISSAALDSEENDLKRKRGKHITFKRTHKSSKRNPKNSLT